jgi:succinate-semialdehyde dehydrogenase/glutarate-semialdehyde dehydrogenase
MAREDLPEGVHRQVEASVAAGARLLAGGHRVDRAGWFYAPTVLADVRAGQPAYGEEIFGPVASVIVVDGDEEAVRVANDTRFGLGASVWTADAERGIAVARRIRSGAVFVNAVVASDVRMPFGGIRASGHGRELAVAGIREFVNVRTWWVLDEPAVTPPASE